MDEISLAPRTADAEKEGTDNNVERVESISRLDDVHKCHYCYIHNMYRSRRKGGSSSPVPMPIFANDFFFFFFWKILVRRPPDLPDLFRRPCSTAIQSCSWRQWLTLSIKNAISRWCKIMLECSASKCKYL